MRPDNARTIADIEFVLGAPGPGSDLHAWEAAETHCTRSVHRHSSPEYGFYIELLDVRRPGPKAFHVVITTQTWRWSDKKDSQPRTSKSLKVLSGRSADVVSWMRQHCDQRNINRESEDES